MTLEDCAHGRTVITQLDEGPPSWHCQSCGRRVRGPLAWGHVWFVLYHLRLCRSCRRKALRHPRWAVDVMRLDELDHFRAEHVAAGGR